MLKFRSLRSHLRATAALPFAMAALAAALVSPAFAAPTFTVLYTFQGGTDGAGPFDSLLADSAGNLYGTTGGGGASNDGTVFKLAPDGTETVLYSFAGGSDGSTPPGNVIKDKSGNLYGVTQGGGTSGEGTAFMLAPDGTETVLHSFTGGSDGRFPYGGLIKDGGKLYGVTTVGGANDAGTVFELTKAKGGGYSESILHSFGGSGDGSQPYAGLIKDSAGNLYGTTWVGGANGDGAVYKITPDGTETVFYSFAGGNDGRELIGGVIEDKAGNLYGTTWLGGANNDGTIFKVAPDGTETVLHTFAGGSDGAYPQASVFADGKGNLYGTTTEGGSTNCGGSGCGTVFKLAPDGTETVLYAFTGGSDGGGPAASLVKDTPDGKADLFGTALNYGATNHGVVFDIKK